MMRLKPVPGASMKTRSVVSSRLYWLSTKGVGRGGLVLGVGRDDAARAEGAHVQPHGGRAGAAVVEEHDRARAWRGAFAEVGRVEHARGRGCVLGLGSVGRVHAGVGQHLAVEPKHGVELVCAADRDGARDGRVGDRLAAERDAVVGRGVGRRGAGLGRFGLAFDDDFLALPAFGGCPARWRPGG